MRRKTRERIEALEHEVRLRAESFRDLWDIVGALATIAGKRIDFIFPSPPPQRVPRYQVNDKDAPHPQARP